MPIYNPDKKMSPEDKLKTAGWFERIAFAILDQTYPEDWKDHVSGVVDRCMDTAWELKKEVHMAEVSRGTVPVPENVEPHAFCDSCKLYTPLTRLFVAEHKTARFICGDCRDGKHRYLIH